MFVYKRCSCSSKKYLLLHLDEALLILDQVSLLLHFKTSNIIDWLMRPFAYAGRFFGLCGTGKVLDDIVR